MDAKTDVFSMGMVLVDVLTRGSIGRASDMDQARAVSFVKQVSILLFINLLDNLYGQLTRTVRCLFPCFCNKAGKDGQVTPSAKRFLLSCLEVNPKKRLDAAAACKHQVSSLSSLAALLHFEGVCTDMSSLCFFVRAVVQHGLPSSQHPSHQAIPG